jgi:hypothetical protein
LCSLVSLSGLARFFYAKGNKMTVIEKRETTKVTVVLEVYHESIEDGTSVTHHVEEKMPWLGDDGIYLVEIKNG